MLGKVFEELVTNVRDKGETLPINALNGANWTLTDTASAKRLKKMEEAGIPLGEYVNRQIVYGIKTGFNKAFIIDDAKRIELITQDPKSAEIIKPLAVGNDIRKWRIDSQDKWLIFTRRGIDINAYPAIKSHLMQWKAELTPKINTKQSIGRKPGTYKWYEIQDNIAYYTEFEKPKIVYPDIAKESRFTLDNNGFYLLNSIYFICSDDLYLLGILNSAAVWEWLKIVCWTTSDEKKGRIQIFRQYITQLSIPNASTNERNAISKLVQKCLDAKGVNCETWEKGRC